MKRISLILALCAYVFTSWAYYDNYDFVENGIYYRILSSTKNEVNVNCYRVDYQGTSAQYFSNYSGSIIIPETVTYNGTTYRVTGIGTYAFYKCTNLISVEIPNSVTSIEAYAFAGCTSLTSVEIPYSVTRVNREVFIGCTSLTSVEIPNSVTSIGRAAFSGCTSLTLVEIPNSVTSIEDYAFAYCI